ncbi:DUF2835 domain-containing protein [Nitrincola sp. MINF-07-Sa-05]|uniref:DUF2835 domain-containing protein n=1 Tax=Nitrincola salilacus TaxID=3400273 RepID=UPI003918047E
MKHLIVDLFITKDEYLKYYRGNAAWVSAVARDGRQVQFPASTLRPYLTHTGIRGSFVIYYDNVGKLIQVDKLGSMA